MKIKCRRCVVRPMKYQSQRKKIKKYQEGNLLIQDTFPFLSPSDRELIKSQLCNSCWEEIFSKEY